MNDLGEFNFQCINAHNGLRNSHGVGPLTYNPEMAKSAQKYAEKIAQMDDLVHSEKEERDNAGENIAMSKRPFENYAYSGLGATVAWYSEIKDYDFNLEVQNTREPTGHFTQVVWKDSKEAGFGRAKNNATNNWYVVGRYQPAGNFLGKYKENVPALPRGLKWENVPIVEEHLEELRTEEYTKVRKHILDDWEVKCITGSRGGESYCEITEIFTTPSGSKYSEKVTFPEDPQKKPRPKYEMKYDDSIYNTDPFGRQDSIKDKPDPFNDDIENFIEVLINQHNTYRNKHGIDNLFHDEELTTHAQDWVEQLAYEDKMSFSNYQYKNQPVGENITSTKGELNRKSALKLMEDWYLENKIYSYGKDPNNFKKVGHFTQIVWKNSKSVGIGIKESRNGKTYIACFYHPAGNVANKFQENVPKPNR